MNNDRNYYENEFAQYSFPYGNNTHLIKKLIFIFYLHYIIF